MTKEGEILRCKNFLQQIEEAKKGIAALVPEPIPENFELDDLYIDCDSWCFEDMAQGIKDKHLQLYFENAHNKYVAILDEIKKRKGIKLTKLLKKNAK